jgi:hypothetical protein
MSQNEKEFAPTGASLKKRFPISNARAWLRLRTACAARLLPLLLLTLSAAVQAQDYNYVIYGAVTITITKYTGSGGAVTIPSTMDGLPVTSLGDKAFEYCTNLTSFNPRRPAR